MEQVDYEALIKSKEDGGVALLDFKAQVHNLACKLAIWAKWEGDRHFLKLILQKEF